MDITPSQMNEINNLKAHFPYRIIYGMIDKDTKEFHARPVDTQGLELANRSSILRRTRFYRTLSFDLSSTGIVN